MGWVARILSFVRVDRNDAKISDVQVDTGGGPNVTAEHFGPAGDDAFPLDTDFATGHTVQQTGRVAVVGYLDPKNTPKALKGEKRIYARDADTGVEVIEVWLKNDGTGTLSNSNGSLTLSPDGSTRGLNGSGSFELQANGDFLVNGVKIASDGKVTIPSSLTLAGKEIAGHGHSQANDSGGNTEQDTGPNN